MAARKQTYFCEIPGFVTLLEGVDNVRGREVIKINNYNIHAFSTS